MGHYFFKWLNTRLKSPESMNIVYRAPSAGHGSQAGSLHGCRCLPSHASGHRFHPYISTEAGFIRSSQRRLITWSSVTIPKVGVRSDPNVEVLPWVYAIRCLSIRGTSAGHLHHTLMALSRSRPGPDPQVAMIHRTVAHVRILDVNVSILLHSRFWFLFTTLQKSLNEEL